MAAGGAIRAGQAFVEFFADNSRLIRGMKMAEKRLKRFGATTRAAGARILGLGVAAATPFAIAAKTFAGFEERMSAVKAITGSTGKDFDALRAMAEKLGATTQFTASQAADGMKFLGMAGFDTQQILAGLPAVLDLAKAGALDLGQAADIASNVSSAFNLTAEEIVRVADVMAKAATSSNTNIEMMGETFKFVAPLAAATGQEIEGIAAAVGILGNNGIQASTAGTDLANVLKQLAAKQDKLKKLGIDVTDDAGDFLALEKILANFGATLKGVPEGKKLKFLTEIFGGRAVKSAAILIKNVEAVSGFRAELEGAAGTAKGMAATMADNLTGSAKTFMSALESLQIQVGDVFDGALRVAIDNVAMFTRSTAEWVKQNPALIFGVGALAAGTVALGTGLVTAGIAIQGIGMAMGGFVKLIGVARVGMAALMSPVGLVVSGLFVGAAAWATFTEGGQASVAALRQLFGNLGQLFRDTFGGITDAMKGGDMALAGQIFKEGMKIAFLETKNTVLGIWNELTNDIVAVFDAAMRGVITSLAAVSFTFDKVKSGAKGFGQQFFDDLGLTMRTVGRGVQGVLNRHNPEALNQLRIDQARDVARGNMSETERHRTFNREISALDKEQAMLNAAIAARDPLANPLAVGGEEKRLAEIAASRANLERLRNEAQASAVNAELGEGGDLRASDVDVEGKVKAAQEAAAAALKNGVGIDLAKLDGSIEKANAVGVRGTFNAAAAQSLLGGTGANPLEKKADKQIEILEEIKKTNKKIAAKEGGLLFV